MSALDAVVGFEDVTLWIGEWGGLGRSVGEEGWSGGGAGAAWGAAWGVGGGVWCGEVEVLAGEDRCAATGGRARERAGVCEGLGEAAIFADEFELDRERLCRVRESFSGEGDVDTGGEFDGGVGNCGEDGLEIGGGGREVVERSGADALAVVAAGGIDVREEWGCGGGGDAFGFAGGVGPGCGEGVAGECGCEEREVVRCEECAGFVGVYRINVEAGECEAEGVGAEAAAEVGDCDGSVGAGGLEAGGLVGCRGE